MWGTDKFDSLSLCPAWQAQDASIQRIYCIPEYSFKGKLTFYRNALVRRAAGHWQGLSARHQQAQSPFMSQGLSQQATRATVATAEPEVPFRAGEPPSWMPGLMSSTPQWWSLT
jgi:hypothetical protein